jgi:hypothetical protein
MPLLVRVFTVMLIVSVCASCKSGVSVTGEAGYTPPFLPVTITIDTNGNISIRGNASIVTPVGTLSIGADVTKSMQSVPEATLLIIRHKKGDRIVDTVFTVRSQKIVAIVDGRVTLTVTNGRIFVDAVKGHVLSITVHSTAAKPTPQHFVAVGVPSRDPLTAADHTKGWPTRYYPPDGDDCGFEQNGFYVGPSSPIGTNWQLCENLRINIKNVDVSVTARLRSDDSADRIANFGDAPEDGYGIVVREPSFPTAGFSVLPDGQWADFYSNGIIDVHPVNPAINKGIGVNNVLEVKAVGSSFKFFVNGVKVGSEYLGSASATGGIGFYVDGFDSAFFKNLVIKAP